MSLLLWMIEKNLHLHDWKNQERIKQEQERLAAAEKRPYRFSYSGWSAKDAYDVGKVIANSCSNGEAIELIAKEWDSLPPIIRMAATNEMNLAHGTRSHNKTKGIRRLDDLLGGRVLRSRDNGLTDRKLVVVDGKLVSTEKKLNVSALAAQGAHAGYGLPENYKNLPPAEKRRLREKLAHQRRESKNDPGPGPGATAA